MFNMSQIISMITKLIALKASLRVDVFHEKNKNLNLEREEKKGIPAKPR